MKKLKFVTSSRDCQMVHFHTKNANTCMYILKDLGWKILVYVSHGHFGIVPMRPFGIFVAILVYVFFYLLVCCTKKNLATLHGLM
jgi:hypothetical protein